MFVIRCQFCCSVSKCCSVGILKLLYTANVDLYGRVTPRVLFELMLRFLVFIEYDMFSHDSEQVDENDVRFT
jgi:hypothetical protein